MYRWTRSYPTGISVYLAILIVALTAAGCGGGGFRAADAAPDTQAAQADRGPSDSAEEVVSDAVDAEAEPEEETPVAGEATRAKKRYDYISTLRGPFGARSQDAGVVRPGTVSGSVSGKADSGAIQLNNWSWHVKVIEVTPTPGAIKQVQWASGTRLVSWSKVDGKLQAVVTGPASMFINKKPTIRGMAEVTIIDAARPGRTGDKVQVRFTGGDYNQALIFSFTTDRTQGNDRAEIALLRNSEKPPK